MKYINSVSSIIMVLILSLQDKEYELVVDELGEIEFVNAMHMPGSGRGDDEVGSLT